MNSLKQRPEQGLAVSNPHMSAGQAFDSAPKALIPLTILGSNIVVRVALVTEAQMNRFLPNESFSGFSGDFIFFNKKLSPPRGIAEFLPQLMAMHALVKMCEVDIRCDSLPLRDHFPIRLELLYAKRLLVPDIYQAYVEWRKEHYHSLFFKEPNWEKMLAYTENGYHDGMRRLLELAPKHPAVKPSVLEWKKELRKMDSARREHNRRKAANR